MSNMKPNKIIYIISLLSLSLLISGCHTTKTVRRNRDNVTVKIDLSHLEKREKAIVEEALTWDGTPYRYAGSEKHVGADCSGMVLKVYESTTGIKMPRNSAEQAQFCKKLNKKKVRPGDLVFFATGKDKDKISHVGIMIDLENFIHASSKGVVISSMDNPYYIRTFKMYGRVP